MNLTKYKYCFNDQINMAKSIKFKNSYIDSSNIMHKYFTNYNKRKSLYEICNNMLISKRAFLQTGKRKLVITINPNDEYTISDKSFCIIVGARNDNHLDFFIVRIDRLTKSTNLVYKNLGDSSLSQLTRNGNVFTLSTTEYGSYYVIYNALDVDLSVTTTS